MLDLKIGLTGLVPSHGACAAPIDLEASGHYADRKASLRVHGSDSAHTLVDGDGTIEVSAATPSATWVASGNIDLTGLPLRTVGEAIGFPMAGTATGHVELRDLHRDAHLEAKLSLDGVSIAHSTSTHVELDATIGDGNVDGSLALTQKGGDAHGTLKGRAIWGGTTLPALDMPSLGMSLEAHHFRIDAIRPFVASTFVNLDGFLDVKGTVQAGAALAKSDIATTAHLEDGTFELVSIGERFHGLKADVSFSKGVLRVDHAEAEGTTGKWTATANGTFDGLAFQKGNAKLRIAKGDRVPIAVEGVPIGSAYGDVNADFTMSGDGKRLHVGVDVPTLGVTLPSSTGHSVQDLADNPAVRIGSGNADAFHVVALGPPVARSSTDALVVETDVKLGSNVEVKRDTTLDVFLTGAAKVVLADQTTVTGEIHLLRGKLDILGKEFSIDRGTVTLTGDPSNAYLIASATWEAPDGTQVHARFAGTPKTGKLNLTSEPALSEDEIVSLILFGSSDQGFGASGSNQSPGAGVEAVGVAGGVVTEGLNRALSGFTSGTVTTRVDSSIANDPEPQIVAQITQRISRAWVTKSAPLHRATTRIARSSRSIGGS